MDGVCRSNELDCSNDEFIFGDLDTEMKSCENDYEKVTVQNGGAPIFMKPTSKRRRESRSKQYQVSSNLDLTAQNICQIQVQEM